MNFHLYIRARFLFLLVLTLCLYFRAGLTGLILEPVLEKELTYLFGTKVEIDGFRADLITGEVSAEDITIFNQPEFSKRPHLKGKLELKVNFPELLHKHVLIDRLKLSNGYFLIEKNIHDNGYEITNIRTWINHMDALGGGEKEEEKNEKPSGWHITIHRQVLNDVVFIYESFYLKNHELFKRYVFQNLYGHLENFIWPTADPGKNDQPVTARGLIGLTHPAPVWAKGIANFASDTVSFDLVGEIRGGSMTEYRHFWTGLPIKVVGGEYDMNARAVCDKGQLKWENDLFIRGLKLKYKRTPAALVWGLPIQASVAFLESQKVIELKVPVQGDVTNPDYDPGLGNAFQEALTRYTQTGMGMFEIVTVKPAVKVVETVSSAVKSAAQEVSKPLFNKENKPSEAEKKI